MPLPTSYELPDTNAASAEAGLADPSAPSWQAETRHPPPKFVSVGEAGFLANDNEAPPIVPLLVRFDDVEMRNVPVLRQGIVAMLVAPGGTGKSQALVQLAIAVAAGKPWLDELHCPKPGRVALVSGEEDTPELHRRIRSSVRAGKLWGDRETIDANLFVLPVSGQQVALTDEQGKPTKYFLGLQHSLGNLGELSLAIFDPGSRFFGPEVELDNQKATSFIECMEKLRTLAGEPTILFAHHTNKSGLNGITDQGAARGSSALVDGARWVANLDRVVGKGQDQGREKDGKFKGGRVVSKNELVLRVVKANHTKAMDDLSLVRDFSAGGFLRHQKKSTGASQHKSFQADTDKDEERSGNSDHIHDDYEVIDEGRGGNRLMEVRRKQPASSQRSRP